MSLRLKLGSALVRAGLWIIGSDELGALEDDWPAAPSAPADAELADVEPDLPTPAQDPLTDESRAMMAGSPKGVALAARVPALEGSAAARYRERQTW